MSVLADMTNRLEALFSTTESKPNGDEWATPQSIFDELNDEFGFTLDVAASEANHKCARYYTKDDNGLQQAWDGQVFCNPPYGRAVGKWLAKGREAAANGATVVFLIPARTDTRWFHEHVYKIADDLRFIKGRLRFQHSDGRCASAPFPSMVVIYRAKRLD
jgi:site-specific DNA-methyltransferase (adenine-specific)